MLDIGGTGKAEAVCAEKFAAQLDAFPPGTLFRITCWHPERPAFIFGRGAGEVMPTGEDRLYGKADCPRVAGPLLKKNNLGYNVYITPLHHDFVFILVDDTDSEKLVQMKRFNLRPNLVISSSGANLQAVFFAAGLTDDEANAGFRLLNQDFGDKKISGVNHPFRAAGFRNMKPAHRDAAGHYPFVTVMDSTRNPCDALVTHSKAAFAAVQAKAKSIRQAPALCEEDGSIDFSVNINDSIIKKAEAHYRFVLKKWPDTDMSRADFMLAEKLSRQGIDSAMIGAAIICTSPDISVRHHNIERYVRKTLAAAGC
jgi:hypothetical protein